MRGFSERISTSSPNLFTERMTGVTSKTVANYRAVLTRHERDALSGLGVKMDMLARLGRVCEEDQAQLSHDEAVSLSLNRLDFQKLRMVRAALDRLEDGQYGICAECGEPIPPKRLQAIPWAQYCVTCQELLAAGASPPEINVGQDGILWRAL